MSISYLKETVDSRCLPTGYSANIVLLLDSCDHCYKKLDKDRLEKDPNILTSDEQDATLIEKENEVVEEVEANRSQEVHTEFINALSHVNTW
ncbi:15368_t:CDS:2 [Funneliformis caledonium]|uniref:15368_t:CDS:1 n=1 Tax=Funneliformis caledonium TaxID=1117310 RepID=A0A9N9I8T4_9GLOM|nr:15368_t:CDS:2 [Funneliformis caledonium]